jgi:hypothetical protein
LISTHHAWIGVDAPYASTWRLLEARARERTGPDAEIDDRLYRTGRMTKRASDLRNQLVVQRNK